MINTHYDQSSLLGLLQTVSNFQNAANKPSRSGEGLLQCFSRSTEASSSRLSSFDEEVGPDSPGENESANERSANENLLI